MLCRLHIHIQILLSYKEIDELCYKQAEEEYMNQPEVDYKKIQEESEEE